MHMHAPNTNVLIFVRPQRAGCSCTYNFCNNLPLTYIHANKIYSILIYLLAHGGGEQEGLPFRGALADDLLHLFREVLV